MADAVGGAASKANGTANGTANGHANGAPSAYAAKFNLADHFIGGNELKNAPPSKVKDFVAEHDGHTVITRVSAFSSLSDDFSRLGVSSTAKLTLNRF